MYKEVRKKENLEELLYLLLCPQLICNIVPREIHHLIPKRPAAILEPVVVFSCVTALLAYKAKLEFTPTAFIKSTFTFKEL